MDYQVNNQYILRTSCSNLDGVYAGVGEKPSFHNMKQTWNNTKHISKSDRIRNRFKYHLT